MVWSPELVAKDHKGVTLMRPFNYSKSNDKINSHSFRSDILAEIAKTWAKAKQILKIKDKGASPDTLRYRDLRPGKRELRGGDDSK